MPPEPAGLLPAFSHALPLIVRDTARGVLGEVFEPAGSAVDPHDVLGVDLGIPCEHVADFEPRFERDAGHQARSIDSHVQVGATLRGPLDHPVLEGGTGAFQPFHEHATRTVPLSGGIGPTAHCQRDRPAIFR